jgi:hypothetical protein
MFYRNKNVLSNTFIFLSILILFSNCAKLKTTQNGWTPENLANYVKNSTHLNSNIIDPEKYLNVSDTQQISEVTKKIKKEFGFETYIIFVTEVSDHYSNPYTTDNKKDLLKFANDFDLIITNGDGIKQMFDIIVIFSIKDKQVKVRIGNKSSDKTRASPKSKSAVVNEIREKMLNKEYGKAALALANQLYNHFAKGPSFRLGTGAIIALCIFIIMFAFMIVLIILCCCACTCCARHNDL